MSQISSLDSLIARSRVYAGIGSRVVPLPLQLWLERTGAMLARRGLTLRSGAAPGSDAAFERGAELAEGRREIFLPWPCFNGHRSALCWPSAEAMELAASVHPNWAACSRAARALHARNCQQILGRKLDAPVDFAVFYARGKAGRVLGGTATAVRLAQDRGIPTFNLFDPEVLELWRDVVRSEERSRVSFWQKLFGSGEA